MKYIRKLKSLIFIVFCINLEALSSSRDDDLFFSSDTFGRNASQPQIFVDNMLTYKMYIEAHNERLKTFLKGYHRLQRQKAGDPLFCIYKKLLEDLIQTNANLIQRNLMQPYATAVERCLLPYYQKEINLQQHLMNELNFPTQLEWDGGIDIRSLFPEFNPSQRFFVMKKGVRK